jgi:hypothetical protein
MSTETPEDPSRPPQSWGQRNALTIIVVLMAAFFMLVVIVQVKS